MFPELISFDFTNINFDFNCDISKIGTLGVQNSLNLSHVNDVTNTLSVDSSNNGNHTCSNYIKCIPKNNCNCNENVFLFDDKSDKFLNKIYPKNIDDNIENISIDADKVIFCHNNDLFNNHVDSVATNVKKYHNIEITNNFHEIHNDSQVHNIQNIISCREIFGSSILQEEFTNDLKLSCIALNVGGLGDKSKYPDFINFVNTHDIICISESKLSNEDSVEFDGFTTFYKNRLKFKKKSGGIVILIRNKYIKHLKIYEEESYKSLIENSLLNNYVFTQYEVCKNAIFFSLDGLIYNKNVLFCAVYIEPDNSDYFNRNVYNELRDTIIMLNYDSVCLLGDFNSRCGNLSEILCVNDYCENFVDLEQQDMILVLGRLNINILITWVMN